MDGKRRIIKILKKRWLQIVTISFFLTEIPMKKTLTLSKTDIKAVMAEKFKVDPDNVTIKVSDQDDRFGYHDYEVSITIELEVQNYDV